jgi:uncharacterized phage-associated protein
MKLTTPKLKAMLLFFATHTDKRLLGKVKLMKLFYFTDFGYVKEYAIPITYDQYINLEHGPIPTTIMNMVNQLEDDIDTSILGDTISINKKEGCPLHRIVATRDFEEKDKGYFSKNELVMLDKICKRFYNSNARQMEESSHQEAAWKDTKFKEKISYSLALQDKDCRVDKEKMDISMKIINSLK